jgi:hypothetical protein
VSARQGKNLLLFAARRADGLWGPPGLLTSEYRAHCRRGVEQTTRLQLVAKEVKNTRMYTSTPLYAFMA